VTSSINVLGWLTGIQDALATIDPIDQYTMVRNGGCMTGCFGWLTGT